MGPTTGRRHPSARLYKPVNGSSQRPYVSLGKESPLRTLLPGMAAPRAREADCICLHQPWGMRWEPPYSAQRQVPVLADLSERPGQTLIISAELQLSHFMELPLTKVWISSLFRGWQQGPVAISCDSLCGDHRSVSGRASPPLIANSHYSLFGYKYSALCGGSGPTTPSTQRARALSRLYWT